MILTPWMASLFTLMRKLLGPTWESNSTKYLHLTRALKILRNISEGNFLVSFRVRGFRPRCTEQASFISQAEWTRSFASLLNEPTAFVTFTSVCQARSVPLAGFLSQLYVKNAGK